MGPNTVKREQEDVTGFLILQKEPGQKAEQPASQREEILLSWKRKICIITLKVS